MEDANDYFEKCFSLLMNMQDVNSRVSAKHETEVHLTVDMPEHQLTSFKIIIKKE